MPFPLQAAGDSGATPWLGPVLFGGWLLAVVIILSVMGRAFPRSCPKCRKVVQPGEYVLRQGVKVAPCPSCGQFFTRSMWAAGGDNDCGGCGG